MIKRVAGTYAVIFLSYFAGETLFGACFPEGMDYGQGFWDILAERLDTQNYSFEYVAIVVVASVFVFLTEMITPGKTNLLLLSVISALTGAVYLFVFYGGYPQYFAAVDYLLPDLPNSSIMACLVAWIAAAVPFVLPLLVLIVTKAVLRSRVKRLG